MVDQASGQSPIRSPIKDGFEDVDLHGVDSKRRSTDSQKSTLEKEDSALGRKHVDVTSPAVGQPTEGLEVGQVMRSESNENKDAAHNEELDEKDDFHSMPPTPLEQ